MINRAILALSIAAAAVAAPAFAADANSCKTAPAAIRSAATTASADQARKALQLVRTGELLCDAGGRAEAGKKFAAAARALGTDMAALTTNQSAQ